jgi:hypothetical protein
MRMTPPERAHFLSDQAFAFLGFAFAAYSPQLALLVSLAVSSDHSVPLPFHGLALSGIPVAFLGTLLIIGFDDLLVIVFVLAAIARYETIFALGDWPLIGIPRDVGERDWSSKRARALTDAEVWFTHRPFRLVWVVIIMVLFFAITSGYLLWLVWIAV